jgi:hypothetical protein
MIRKSSPLRVEIVKELMDIQEEASGNHLSNIQKKRINDEMSGYPLVE